MTRAKRKQKTLQDHVKAGWEAFTQGKVAQAHKHLRRARNLQPNTPVAAIGMLEAELLRDAGYDEIGRNHLLTIAKAFPDNPWPLRRLSEMAEDAGDVETADMMLTAAIARDPDGTVPVLRQQLIDLHFRVSPVSHVLQLLDTTVVAQDWATGMYQRLAQRAIDQGDVKDALVVLAQSPATALWRASSYERLVQGLIEGDKTEAALEVLASLPAEVEQPWVSNSFHRLVQRALHNDDLDSASELLGKAPLEADWVTKICWSLVEKAHEQGAPDKALLYLERGAMARPNDVGLQMACARNFARIGEFDKVIARLEPIMTSPQADMDLLMQLLWACRACGLSGKEVTVLERAVKIAPRDTRVLRYMLTHHADKADPKLLDNLVSNLPDIVPPDASRELTIQALLERQRFPEALAHIRGRDRSQGTRVRDEAVQLVRALFGAQKVALGLRYLQACLYHWPKDEKLIWSYIVQALSLGQFDQAEAALHRAKDHLSDKTLNNLWVRVHACRIDLDAAIDAYVRLCGSGPPNIALRDVLSKLIYTSLDLKQADYVYARIGKPGEGDGRLLHRAGLAGAMAMEFEMEREMHIAEGGYGGLAAWVKARPETPIPAIRLIDDWRSSRTGAKAKQGRVIPKKIFQYWDSPNVPHFVDQMMASWAAVSRYSYQRLNRAEATQFLRSEFGVDWARAFALARDAAEQSDLLRMCLLIKHGGIWADADDFLYGRLGVMLRGQKGLVVYREPSGGALGNNFMAAAPEHPVLIAAAEIARDALLQRQGEGAWNKTGPGVLTRAAGQYLQRCLAEGTKPELAVLEYQEVARNVSMHNHVRYKTSAVYWEAAQARSYPFKVWTQLAEALDIVPDRVHTAA